MAPPVLRLGSLSLLLLSLSACPLAFRAPPCSTDSDCSSGVCDLVLERCAGTETNDDAGTLREPDSEPSVGPSLDGGPDAEPDVGPDGGPTPEPTPDGGEPAPDGGEPEPDFGPDVDAGPSNDAGPPSDGGPTFGTDAGPDGGLPCLDVDGDGFGPRCPAGPDCSPNNPNAHTFYSGYLDDDNDGYTLAQELRICSGPQFPAGYQPQISDPIDCDDTNAALYRSLPLYVDDDQDTYTVGAGFLTCIGDTPPDGFALSASDDDDCDDDDGTLYRLVSLALDQDLDTFTIGPLSPVCIGAAIPQGYASVTSPLDDCDDTDDQVGTSADTDNDGIPDCLDNDDDNDGLSDADEAIGVPPGFPTDPLVADTDGDGVLDSQDAAATVASCAANVHFADAFDTDPFTRWTFNHPNEFAWNAAAASLDIPDDFVGAAGWVGPNPSLTDYVVEAILAVQDEAGDAGLTFRVQSISTANDGGAHYYVGINQLANQVVLGYMDGGYTQLASTSVAIANNRPYRLRVEVEGEDISVYLDDALVISHNDDTYAFGSAGVRSFLLPVRYQSFIVCD